MEKILKDYRRNYGFASIHDGEIEQGALVPVMNNQYSQVPEWLIRRNKPEINMPWKQTMTWMAYLIQAL